MKQETSPLRYSMDIVWDSRDNIFVVGIPEFTRCHTHGRTYEEAVRNGREVMTLCYESEIDYSDQAPSPHLYEATIKTFESAQRETRGNVLAAVEVIPPYSMTIAWSSIDEVFVVTVPELPGCVTHGTTYETAIEAGKDAIRGWVRLQQLDGLPLPRPREYSEKESAHAA